MQSPLPSRRLPAHPDLNQLKHQAKDLLEAFRAGRREAADEVHRFYHGADPDTFALHHAQLVLARAYGFGSWPKLKAYVDGANVDRLANAVRAGDEAQVRAVLDVRPELVNLTVAWNNGHTALHYAVLGRMPGMVRLLMRRGANAHAGIYPRLDATTPLTIARDRGYDEIVAIISQEEQRRSPKTPIGGRPALELREAVMACDESRAMRILDAHADLVHVREPRRGWAPLHAAAALLLQSLTAWLLQRGADVNVAASDGSTPLDVIGRACDPATRAARLPTLANMLRQKGAILSERSAVILGDEQFLRARHAAGRLQEPLDERGWLLGLAVAYDQPEMLQLLLDLGLDADARVRVDPEGAEEVTVSWGMPLYECARTGKYAMAEMLLARGADPNGQVYASGTPLSEAYGQRDERMIALLERHGGRSNASMAGLYRRKDLAERLLAEHGDATLPDDGFSSGTVAEQLIGAAARGGDPDVLRMGMARVNWPDGDARWYGPLQGPLGFWNHGTGPWCHPEWDRSTYLACFRMILARTGPPDRRLRFGTTILHEIVTMRSHVTAEERVAFAAAALDAGAGTGARDDLLRSTPLGWAARWGRLELVQQLIDRGADPKEPDAEPWATPIAWAAKMGHQAVARLLEERGA